MTDTQAKLAKLFFVLAVLFSLAERVYVYTRLSSMNTRVERAEALNDRLFEYCTEEDERWVPMDMYTQAR